MRWLSVDGVIKKVLQVHVRAGQHSPRAFLSAIGRWECTKYEALHSLGAPSAHEREAVPASPQDATHMP